MTQTATFPDLESYPNLSDQALLYFSATMGTLTEVDVVTSGSFNTQFAAENLASSSRTIAGTTSANLSINVPTGAMPVVIPPVTESFNASGFDGHIDDGGTSGKTFASVTSSSAPQTTVLTSPAALAAFTGHFRIPFSVTGHATGSTTPNDGNVSASFKTDTSATITVIYHYIPNLSDTGSSPGTSTSSPGGTSTSPNGSSSGVQALTGTTDGSTAHANRQRSLSKRMSHPHHPVRHHPAKPASLSRHHGQALRTPG
jgi:hypothetical protein